MWTCNHCRSTEHYGMDCPERLASILRRAYEYARGYALDDGGTPEQAIGAGLRAAYEAGRASVPRCGTCRHYGPGCVCAMIGCAMRDDDHCYRHEVKS